VELTLARPDVLIAGAGTLTALALKAATTAIPTVFTSVGDPVGAGVIPNIARPGGNITGLTGQSAEVSAKRLELLREVIPDSRLIALLMNPATPFAILALKETRAAAESVYVRLEILELRTRDQLVGKFESAIKVGASGMIVSSDPLTYELRHQISDLAARFRLPTMYGHRDHPQVGGLMSYGANRRAMYRRAAEYADKILKGAKPADLPVEQPTKFELVINIKTAKALGLTIPPSLLARADQVIE
jgi:putative ABC transport system substrate-binding protein